MCGFGRNAVNVNMYTFVRAIRALGPCASAISTSHMKPHKTSDCFVCLEPLCAVACRIFFHILRSCAWYARAVVSRLNVAKFCRSAPSSFFPVLRTNGCVHKSFLQTLITPLYYSCGARRARVCVCARISGKFLPPTGLSYTISLCALIIVYCCFHLMLFFFHFQFVAIAVVNFTFEPIH